MKSKNHTTIEAVKRMNLGMTPVFIQMAHRSLEKNKPDGKKNQNTTTFVVAKDIMRVTITDHTLLDSIESLELVYKNR